MTIQLEIPASAERGEHGWMALQGALLFGLNYVCVYLAESRISSGLVAVIFSLINFGLSRRSCGKSRSTLYSQSVRRFF